MIKIPTLTTVVLACSALAPPVTGQDPETEPGLLAGHSSHGEAFNEGPRQQAYLMGGCGDLDFDVTTEADPAQQFFIQGVGQLHGFWHFEAERSFRQVAKIDPGCAMAYWGMAMANVDNPDRAAGFIEQAVARQNGATPRERMWIDSLAAFYEVTPESVEAGRGKQKDPAAKPKKRKFKASKKDRSKALAAAYEELAERFPSDTEPKAFLVNRVWLNRKARLPTKNYQHLEDLLQQVFEANPNHPAHHYRIHLWDKKDAKRALVSAAVSGQSCPSIAHQWHMSGHIFAKLHRHADAVWQQTASARVDHAHMMRDRVMPYQIHNFGHNNEWLCRSLTHVGRGQDALALAKNMVDLPRHPKKNRLSRGSSIAGYGRKKLLETCRKFLLLDDLRDLHDRGYFDGDDGAASKLAAAYLSMGDLDRGKKLMAKKKVPPVSRGDDRSRGNRGDRGKRGARSRRRRGSTSGRSGRRAKELDGLLALAEGRLDEARKLLKRPTMAKIYLADVRLALGEVKEARKLIDAEAKSHPNRAEIMARQVRILMADEDRTGARRVFDRLRSVAGHGDIDAPLFARLGRTASEFGYPEDWRRPLPTSADAGVRPDLADLGPFRWKPSPTLDWALPCTDGRQIRMKKTYAGKPVLVIFYLGFGCLHCVEQLQAFHPMAEQFQAAGIEIVAIGSDSVKGMETSLAAMSAEDRFTFPLVSDPEMNVFKAWRAYDDFENMPLHGTFLVDGAGMVRWQDISYEPFNQPDWLLKECERLLRQPRSVSR